MQTETTITGTTATTYRITRFSLRQVFMTPGALEALEEANQLPDEFLRRHQSRGLMEN